ncbi:GNAT family N-acetyltransferase [Deinococcus sp. Leaf326]|uniref:GNAT family N-acetyltransferase n=1 Tax=Deinococcus sp. Leaf326 TaxID=1736338 RepID=UPI0006F1D430|nr:GNAT family N-acetyltransferase [Deinococcus sp. Leaf326]KQQ99397.1 hypothetical protein ASF71_13540 [Deinococcus sp. Leaf326]
MNTLPNTAADRFVVTPATAETLDDLYVLHPDREDASRGVERLRGRIATGQVQFGQVLILRGPRGVEGTLLLAGNPAVPLFPRLRPGSPAAAITALLGAARAQVSLDRRLILDCTLAPLGAAPALAAGWRHTETHVLYETDLRAYVSVPDPAAREASVNDPAVRALLADLGRADWVPEEDEEFVALFGQGDRPCALGTVRPGHTPDLGMIDLIGVRPGLSGQGYGTRLHAHLLGRVAKRFGRHVGATGADNLAMRRILARHGALDTSVQEVYLPLALHAPDRV